STGSPAINSVANNSRTNTAFVVAKLLICAQLTRLRLQHYRNTIPYRVSETTGATHQLLLFPIVFQRRSGDRADKNAEKLFIHMNIHKVIALRLKTRIDEPT